VPYLRPDGKTQVSVVYEDGRPVRIDTVLISTQHASGIDLEEQLRPDLTEHVINPLLPTDLDTDGVRIFVNPTGIFELGGPHADTGLTGRKIIVDTYGGMGRHGGGAFSGKDPTKVDRSACYMARYVAKNIVSSGLADRAEVQLAYAIGVAEPVSIMVNTFGTGKVEDARLAEIVRENFSLTPAGMIKSLNLRRPIYQITAAFGHFGRTEESFTWEATDKAKVLREAAQLTSVA
jgi:S-adenosylmethionine synthetase